MLDYLSEVSVFDHSAIALFLILAADFAFTLIHTLQEWKGPGGPLWKNFGAVVGVRIPDWLGFSSFFLGLTAGLWLVGLVAITGSLPSGAVRMPYAAAALGALVGARLTDTVVSHVLLWALGYRPNPGLSSTPLYVIEALFLMLTFSRGLAAGGSSTGWGVAAGSGFFLLVLPGLWALRIIVPGWRRERWHPGEPLTA